MYIYLYTYVYVEPTKQTAGLYYVFRKVVEYVSGRSQL